MYEDPPPHRVWIWEGDRPEEGALERYSTVLDDGEYVPSITIGPGCIHGELPALGDRWVILHELAHVMTILIRGEGWHGPNFTYMYQRLAYNFISPKAGRLLRDACREVSMRLDYDLFLS